MKLKLSFLSIALLVFGSCKHEPRIPYAYEQNPEYTYMGIGFYGQYYDSIPNYVFSLTFLSDGMLSKDSTDIIAAGQYLYIEDLFLPEQKIKPLFENVVLTEKEILNLLKGEYKISGKVGSVDYGDSLTFTPGEYFKVDNITYVLGTRITYYEENDNYSTRKLVTEGTFAIAEDGVVFDLRTEDELALKGSYKMPLERVEINAKMTHSSKREFEQLR